MNKIQLEHNTLSNIYENQRKAIHQFSSNFENKSEMKAVQERLKSLKEEYKVSKEENTIVNEKLKAQYKQTRNIDDKCKKMKEKFLAIKKYAKSNSETVNENDINTLEENIDLIKNEIQVNEESHKIELAQKQMIISDLNKKIIEITSKITDKQQDAKMNEIKAKEYNIINSKASKVVLKPLKNRSSSATKHERPSSGLIDYKTKKLDNSSSIVNFTEPDVDII